VKTGQSVSTGTGTIKNIRIVNHPFDDSKLRKKRDSFDIGKHSNKSITRMSGPRDFSRTRAEHQVLRQWPTLTMSEIMTEVMVHTVPALFLYNE